MKHMRFHSYMIMIAAFLFFSACTDDVAPSEEWMPSLTVNEQPGDDVLTVAGVRFKMILVKAGTFEMGSDNGSSDEKPVHTVTISRDFYIGETEVTQALWESVMGTNPSRYKGDSNNPVESVSWEECQEFIAKLNSLLPGRNFRLPTEAEWEFAARDGNITTGTISGGSNIHTGTIYSGSNTIGDVAWSGENSGSKTHCVKTKSPNRLGIYDMSGNVREWCSDWYSSNYYRNSEPIDPKGPEISDLVVDYSSRVVRGGSWYDLSGDCCVFSRNHYLPAKEYDTIGLRIVSTSAK